MTRVYLAIVVERVVAARPERVERVLHHIGGRLRRRVSALGEREGLCDRRRAIGGARGVAGSSWREGSGRLRLRRAACVRKDVHEVVPVGGGARGGRVGGAVADDGELAAPEAVDAEAHVALGELRHVKHVARLREHGESDVEMAHPRHHRDARRRARHHVACECEFCSERRPDLLSFEAMYST